MQFSDLLRHRLGSVVHSIFVHIVSDPADSGYCFRLRCVADIDEADLIVFAVAPSGSGLVFVLEPVCTDDVRICKCALNIAFICFGAVVLVLSLIHI